MHSCQIHPPHPSFSLGYRLVYPVSSLSRVARYCTEDTAQREPPGALFNRKGTFLNSIMLVPAQTQEEGNKTAKCCRRRSVRILTTRKISVQSPSFFYLVSTLSWVTRSPVDTGDKTGHFPFLSILPASAGLSQLHSLGNLGLMDSIHRQSSPGDSLRPRGSI